SFAAGIGLLAAMQAVAPSLGMELTPIDVREPGEIEQGIREFARVANGGLVVPASPSQGAHRELIITLAARHRLPAVYPFRYMVRGGGLISLRGSHSPGPETCRASGSGASEVRAGDQSQNRKHARPEPASDRARSRRRGDRMSNCHLVAGRSLIDLVASR